MRVVVTLAMVGIADDVVRKNEKIHESFTHFLKLKYFMRPFK